MRIATKPLRFHYTLVFIFESPRLLFTYAIFIAMLL